MNKNKFVLAAILGLGLIGNAQAVDNGDFAAGLDGWQTLGDVAVADGAALLTNASLDFADDYPAVAGAFNLSGTSAGLVGEADGVEDFAGLNLGELDLGDYAYEGSVLKQTFTAQAGDTLSFDWRLFSNEGTAGYQDFAFVAIDGVVSSLATAADAGLASAQFSWESGPGSFSFSFASSGAHTLALGVVDLGDYNVSSALRVDNVVLTPVPEPETWSMLLIGLGLILMAIRRHHNTHHNRIGDAQNA